MNASAVSVAVVDDEKPVCFSLTRLLRSAGYETSAYASGRDFLASLSESHPDCVVLDLLMPGMSGHEVQDRLALAGLPVPVVVITGNEIPGARDRAFRAGAANFLRKPVDASDLITAIETAIRMHRSTIGP
jgi:FixJ family two-component response regulator